MKRRVVWSDDARADQRAIVSYFAEIDPDVADRLIDIIEDAGKRLGDHDTGRPGRTHGTREKSVPRIKYILSYRIEAPSKGDVVTILRVVHSSQNWPRGGWPKSSLPRS